MNAVVGTPTRIEIMTSTTRLHLRFAAATAAVIATVGGALLLYVKHQEVQQAERNVSIHAAYVAKSVLRDELGRADVSRPVSGPRLAQLDRLFRERVLVDGALRVKIYRAGDGLVTYSNVHSLIRTHTDSRPELDAVLGGKVVRDVSYLNHEGGSGKNVKTLEVYVPLRLRGDARAHAAFEVYQSYAPVAASIRSFVLPFGLLLLLALVGLWAALFPLVQRMTRASERSRTARRAAETALEETSEQLRQAQKMDAIGRLAGGVAHDFNNLLVGINGYADFLVSSLEDPRQRHYAEEIHAAGNRAAGLTQQLLAFSRRQVMASTPLSLNDCVEDIASMLRRLLDSGVVVELELDTSLRPAEADPGQIGQVILNLAVNARDAMSGQGTLRISTFNDGSDIVLEVTDDGEGMDEETRSRIFEPFFTTKATGLGTGLGLSTVYGIVTQSGGTIDVRSSPGAGATFAIRLPATEKPLVAAPEADGRDAARGGTERILVVDDEQIVRDLVAQMLREQGYDVCVVGSAQEARSLGVHWDLLLTDVVMPGTDGVTLSSEIDADHVLFISGYDQEALVAADASFLQKPFRRDDLVRAVRGTLDGEAAAVVASVA